MRRLEALGQGDRRSFKSSGALPRRQVEERAKLARHDGVVGVEYRVQDGKQRDRHPSGPALVYTRAEISAFLTGVKDGDFDDLT